MKLLVTGGAGYIGSNVAHQLADEGHDLVILDNLSSGHRWAPPANAEFVLGDIADPELLQNLFSAHCFDGILHFAASLLVGESVANPIKYYENNVVGSLTLFKAASAAKISKIVFSSTAAVYGDPKLELIPETSPNAPINPYGATKMVGEQMLRDVCAASGGAMKYVALRYFNAAGARRDLKAGESTYKSTHLVKIAAEVAYGVRESVAVYGSDYPTADGSCLRDYIHIEDLAQAHVEALKYLDRGGASDAFNVGYGRMYSVREVLETMRKVTGKHFPILEGPRRAGDPAILGAETAKIRHVLGWKPQFDDLELICRTAYEWEQKLQTEIFPRFATLK